MKSPKNNLKKGGSSNKPASTLFSGNPTQGTFLKPRLKLTFFDLKTPQLDAVEFWADKALRSSFLKQKAENTENDIQWVRVPQALALCFVEYCIAGLDGRAETFTFDGGRGSLAYSLCNDIRRTGGKVWTLFRQLSAGGAVDARVHFVFDDRNTFAPINIERSVRIKHHYLPPENVEIVWLGTTLTNLDDLWKLNLAIREGWKLEPSRQLDSRTSGGASEPAADSSEHPIAEVKTAEEPRSEPTAENDSPKPLSKKTAAPSETYCLDDFPELEAKREGIVCRLITGMKPEEIFRDSLNSELETTLERVTNYCSTLMGYLYPMDGSLSPEHLKVFDDGYRWDLDMPIWNAWEDVWTLDDVTQGTLILGATGSGKTTGSGSTLAQAFLAQQFGGLVLTTKKDEARDWCLLASHLGRADDIRWVRYDGPHKINLLAYETQRSGAGARLTENLVGFFRVLLGVMGNYNGNRPEEGFWQAAGNQLLRNLFDVYLLSKSPLTLDTLAEFVVHAPQVPPKDDESWRKLEVFGSVLSTAELNAKTPAEVRSYNKLKAYWLADYAKLPAKTRSCITVGFSAMMDVLRSQHIYELLSTQTTFTPEYIFSGGIVVLDLPVKEFGDAGIMVQSAIKYLFQRAVERREDLGDRMRPVFLWEDEGQNFYSEHDSVFQATARSSRVARVLISQNLSNFYSRLGGGQRAKHLFDSLAANLNTRIFHSNGDMLTNEWASRMFGTKAGSGSSTQVMQGLDQRFQPPHLTQSSNSHPQPILMPEDFAELRFGGKREGFLTEAYIYRVGMRTKQTGKPFLRAGFRVEKVIKNQKQTED
jgi:hypothetical protein